MDHSKLPLVDRKEYTCAKEGARNEVALLKSIYNHPECDCAKAITGRNYKVVAVFDTALGAKATVVAGVIEKQSIYSDNDVSNQFKNSTNDENNVS